MFKEALMRRLKLIALVIPLVIPLALSACGGGDETVVVNPAPGQTVVVPSDGDAKVCQAGQSC